MRFGFPPSLTGKQVDHGRGLFHADNTATVLLQCDTRALYLTRSGLAAQLGYQFVHLTEARGADRMPLRLQAARGVYRDASAEGEFTAAAADSRPG
jgi:hypothetical protein